MSKEIDKNANEILTTGKKINSAEEHMKSHNWKIIIADDDEDIHVLTKIVLEDYDFAGQKIEFLDAYSGEETISLLKENPDTALILLDVV
ncbi:MAG: hybrid sensor histidine kinase/response regulator, partial [Spirochaetota bacterium]